MTVSEKMQLAIDMAKKRGLPAHQNEHAETLINQLLTFALDACVVADASVDQKDGMCVMPSGGVKAVNECIANLLLAVALDVCHIFGGTLQEKGKEEGKEKIPPHPPIEKGPEESEKEPPPRACARARKGTRRLTKAESDMFEGFFNVFWEEYPAGRKVARYGDRGCEQKLKSRFRMARDKEAFVREVIEGLHKHLACPDWAAGYIPLTTTFINQERWREEPRMIRTGCSTNRGVSQTANVKANRGCQW